ncbi:unnamed protein product [Schistosoma margrebowiei]|uniref:Uncharacterized protein n=1 Tax=Schistosoma margrebowiei TaxID=48269 RepID=A0AA84ZS99_9TREM|nr:unnamed protein product [Schistosoma margrebowiei]
MLNSNHTDGIYCIEHLTNIGYYIYKIGQTSDSNKIQLSLITNNQFDKWNVLLNNGSFTKEFRQFLLDTHC